MESKLEILKQVQHVFDLQSDHSSRTNGYNALKQMISDAEKRDSDAILQEIESSFDRYFIGRDEDDKFILGIAKRLRKAGRLEYWSEQVTGLENKINKK